MFDGLCTEELEMVLRPQIEVLALSYTERKTKLPTRVSGYRGDVWYLDGYSRRQPRNRFGRMQPGA